MKLVGHQGFQQILDHMAKRMAEFELRPAILRFDNGVFQLAPGESRIVEAEIQLPRDLPLNKRISGSVGIYNSTLHLQIEIYGNNSTSDSEV